jgi:alpha-amylase
MGGRTLPYALTATRIKMKQRTALILVLALILVVLPGCNRTAETPVPATPTAAVATTVVTSAAGTPGETEEIVTPTETAETAAETATTSIEAEETPPAPENPAEADVYPWWDDTIFYEIFVRSFQDSDGDGIGDINGLIDRLDYLNDGDPETTDDLGVTGIWLMPIMESPSYHGYDVVDYYRINQEYGTEQDFRRLLEEAHARGIKVIIDLVMNHTSREHPWFQESLDPSSARRDWYIWVDEDPGYLGPWGQRVWHKADGSYYYGLFSEGMPDLNLENPAVTEEMYQVARYWLVDMGVDGFRLDAIRHMVERGAIQENTPATHAWLQEFYTFYKGIDPQAFTVGEAWTATQQIVDYTGDEVDIAFQFDLAQSFINASHVGLGPLVENMQAEIVDSFPPGQYAVFLTNHDQNRVMSQLKGDEAAAKVAASLLLTSPGVPFIYYGEEIGMLGEKPDEDIRRPMQWTADEPGAGFSDGRPWRPPYADYPERNVAAQDADANSLLSHYRALIRLRNDHPALREGEWLAIEADPGRLYAALRYDNNEALLVLINASGSEVSDYSLALSSGPLNPGAQASPIFGRGDISSPAINAAGGFDQYMPLVTLPAHSTFVIRISLP